MQLFESKLDVVGIRELFQATVCAEDYERGKAHLAPFLLAAKLMSVPPEDCAVFEDIPMGIDAAKAANMAWVSVPGPMER
jgi:HAD superfamily hydrolase (TIGR01509 family)